MKLFPETLATMDLVLPKVPKMKAMKDRPEFLHAESTEEETSCILHRLFNGYNVFRNK